MVIRPMPLTVLVCVAVVAACGSDATDPMPVVTTPSSVPVGDYPPIPLPQNAGGTTVTRSDSVNTTIMPLATDFNPRVLAIAGNWLVKRFQTTDAKDLWCSDTVVNGGAWSDFIVLDAKEVDCPLFEGPYRYIVYPYRHTYIRTYLTYNEERVLLMQAGAVRPGANQKIMDWDEIVYGTSQVVS